MPFKRAAGLREVPDSIVQYITPTAFQCPLSGQLGCGGPRPGQRSGGSIVSMPCKRAAGLRGLGKTGKRRTKSVSMPFKRAAVLRENHFLST